MLLNYNKPVQVSSTLGGYQPNYAVDEDIKTYWSAKTGNSGEWFQTDLGEVSTINAIQINYADQDAEFMGKTLGKMHQYKIYGSNDGKKWNVIVDKSKNTKDVPHDYVELEQPAKARFLKNYDLYSNLVFNETLNRISFSNNESAAKQYIAAFNSINSSSRELVRKNGQLLQLVDSPPLESTYNRYLSLSSSIPTQINSRNFTQIDSKLSEMQAASDDLVQLYQNISYSFELTKNASRDANKQILFLSSKDLDPSTSASLDLLKERVNSLNSRFGSKVPASSLGSMEANYSQLLNESTAILESDTEVPTSKATNLLRSLSKKTNYGLLDFISQTHMNVAPDNLFIILSVLLFLGFSSLFALIFFYSVLSLRAISSQFRQVMMFV